MKIFNFLMVFFYGTISISNGQKMPTNEYFYFYPLGGNIQEQTIGVGYGRQLRPSIVGNVVADFIFVNNGIAKFPDQVNGKGGKITGSLKIFPYFNRDVYKGAYMSWNVWLKYNSILEEMWRLPIGVNQSWYKVRTVSSINLFNIGSNLELGYMFHLTKSKKYYLDISGGLGLHYNMLQRNIRQGPMWDMAEPINLYFFNGNNQLYGLFPMFNYKIGIVYKL